MQDLGLTLSPKPQGRVCISDLREEDSWVSGFEADLLFCEVGGGLVREREIDRYIYIYTCVCVHLHIEKGFFQVLPGLEATVEATVSSGPLRRGRSRTVQLCWNSEVGR